MDIGMRLRCCQSAGQERSLLFRIVNYGGGCGASQVVAEVEAAKVALPADYSDTGLARPQRVHPRPLCRRQVPHP